MISTQLAFWTHTVPTEEGYDIYTCQTSRDNLKGHEYLLVANERGGTVRYKLGYGKSVATLLRKAVDELAEKVTAA